MSTKPSFAVRGHYPGEYPVALIEVTLDRAQLTDRRVVVIGVPLAPRAGAPVVPLTTRGGRG